MNAVERGAGARLSHKIRDRIKFTTRLTETHLTVASAKHNQAEELSKMHFIRQVDGGGRTNVLNEALKVGGGFISEYVRDTICTGNRKMEVCYRAKGQDVAVLIKEFDYELNGEVKPRRDDIWKT